MKTYISDVIPKIQKFSQKLDNLTLLTNQHWVLIGEINNSKVVYIFRSNNDLLISQFGKVEKARWEYLGNNTLLIDRKNDSYLFKHGFFDQNVLALKIDGLEEYAFLVNETKYDGEINSMEKVIDFLSINYIKAKSVGVEDGKGISKEIKLVFYDTEKGPIGIPPCISYYGQPVYLRGNPAPDGKYKLSWLCNIHVQNGFIVKESSF
ncbi:hypothetical protein J2X31_000926 [Flavobacterium arsenatis]|uniref:Uncharacterized protein n=1 Tax=Flavobacterium arsenatis TaxID=1484332 RepID=A0ABU1TM35_9FLAO|nr:hypothetical protein [Flavobacterium arsenatis]MDR6966926.1 hypothetical protein [Flavobacterium arsenatis]